MAARHPLMTPSLLYFLLFFVFCDFFEPWVILYLKQLALTNH